jgi:hypothetical protein
VASLLAARGVDRAGAGERGKGCFASHAAGIAARDEQLSAADRPHTALLEQRGCDLGDQGSECALGLCHLRRESLHTPAEPPQNAVYDFGAGPQPSRSAGESVPRERSQTLAHGIGSGNQKRVQLVEGGVARLHGAASLEQEQAQVLALTAAPGKAQAFAAQQPPRGQSRVDQIALPTPALLAARTLTLEDIDASTLEEANKPRTVTARALHREAGNPSSCAQASRLR